VTDDKVITNTIQERNLKEAATISEIESTSSCEIRWLLLIKKFPEAETAMRDRE
jgi:hypothetical protein